jgi:hypothetical protein
MSWMDYWFGKKKEATKPERKLLPHEILPDIIYWEEDDDLYITVERSYGFLNSCHWKFIGVTDDIVYLQCLGAFHKHKIFGFSLNALQFCYNEAAEKRKSNNLIQEIRNQVKLSHYYEVKKILEEKKDATFEEWLDTKQKELVGVKNA